MWDWGRTDADFPGQRGAGAHTTRYFMGTGRIWGPVLVLVRFLVKQTLRMCSSRRKSCIVWGFLLKCNPKGFICKFIG